MSIPAIESITAGESKSVSITLSSLYQTGTPSITVTPITGLNKPIFSTPSCTEMSSNGSSCPFVITTESTTESGTYTFSAISFSGNVTAHQSFNVITPLRLVIFVTSEIWNGNLGGFVGVDLKCNNDVSKPVGGATYKAGLYGNNSTIAGRTYYRSDKVTVIAIATGTDLVGLNSLINSISIPSQDYVWTGASFSARCMGWTSDANANEGAVGVPSSDTSTWVYDTVLGCDTLSKLYCVEQPQ